LVKKCKRVANMGKKKYFMHIGSNCKVYCYCYYGWKL